MEKRQDPQAMAALLARRERYGWSWPELSRRSGLPTWKFQWWRRRLSRAGSREAPDEPFVAVEVVGAQPPSPGSLEILTASGHRIVVPVGFESDHLLRVLRVLESLC